jgi:ribosomal protein S18 acetylase RimI-like enzyme
VRTAGTHLRCAVAAEIPALAAIAERAYAKYVERIGRRPPPMDPDFAAPVAAGEVDVIEHGGVLAGFVVWRLAADHVFIDNVAVDPAHAGLGLGKALLARVEARAAALGIRELRLYTNARMTENLAMYPRLGWEVTDRRTERGLDRFYFRKRLRP